MYIRLLTLALLAAAAAQHAHAAPTSRSFDDVSKDLARKAAGLHGVKGSRQRRRSTRSSGTQKLSASVYCRSATYAESFAASESSYIQSGVPSRASTVAVTKE